MWRLGLGGAIAARFQLAVIRHFRFDLIRRLTKSFAPAAEPSRSDCRKCGTRGTLFSDYRIDDRKLSFCSRSQRSVAFDGHVRRQFWRSDKTCSAEEARR